jgi:hypothetical protein
MNKNQELIFYYGLILRYCVISLPNSKHISLPKGKHIGLPKGKHIGYKAIPLSFCRMAAVLDKKSISYLILRLDLYYITA